MEGVKTVLRAVWNYRRLVLILITPLLLVPLPICLKTKVAECAFVLILMAVYWLTEALPLSVTAMLPALLFPLFGILKSTEVAQVYFKDFHLLLIGVICLATSIEKWGLHRRIALRLVTLVGVHPGWLMLGFMAGCGFLSMWVSNTSAVAMVMPIVEAVLQQILRTEGEAVGVDNPALQLDEMGAQNEKKEDIISTENDPDSQVYTIPFDEPLSHNNNSLPTNQRGYSDYPINRPLQKTIWRTFGGTEVPEQKVEGLYRTKRGHMICKALCICIAYSSSMGGIATLPGTSSNLIFSEYMTQFYPACDLINFGNWLVMCVPISILVLLLSWIWLYWLFIGSEFLLRFRGGQSEQERETARVIEEEYKALGPMSPQEVVTQVIFLLMVLLWFTRNPGFMPGWALLFPQYEGYATDATAALLLGLLLFIIPAHGPSTKTFEAMITWKEFQACMPWEVCLLVGGGFALAEGTQVSGLSSWVANLLTPLGNLPDIATVTIACVIVTSITEVASNAATITIFLPILAPLAEAIQVNPLYMLIPTTICTSFSFLLPVSNPPNAIVFSYGHLSTMDLVKAGLGTNVIGVLVVLLAVTTWGVPLFGLDTYPDWVPLRPMTNTTVL